RNQVFPEIEALNTWSCSRPWLFWLSQRFCKQRLIPARRYRQVLSQSQSLMAIRFAPTGKLTALSDLIPRNPALSRAVNVNENLLTPQQTVFVNSLQTGKRR